MFPYMTNICRLWLSYSEIDYILHLNTKPTKCMKTTVWFQIEIQLVQ